MAQAFTEHMHGKSRVHDKIPHATPTIHPVIRTTFNPGKSIGAATDRKISHFFRLFLDRSADPDVQFGKSGNIGRERSH
jgi:hypothetical protein